MTYDLQAFPVGLCDGCGKHIVDNLDRRNYAVDHDLDEIHTFRGQPTYGAARLLGSAQLSRQL